MHFQIQQKKKHFARGFWTMQYFIHKRPPKMQKETCLILDSWNDHFLVQNASNFFFKTSKVCTNIDEKYILHLNNLARKYIEAIKCSAKLSENYILFSWRFIKHLCCSSKGTWWSLHFITTAFYIQNAVVIKLFHDVFRAGVILFTLGRLSCSQEIRQSGVHKLCYLPVVSKHVCNGV